MEHLKELPQYAKFVSCVEEHSLISNCNQIIVAVSGGADSVALLCLFMSYVPTSRLVVVHVNHGIRGEEALRDANFVRDLCARFQLEFQLKEVDIPTLSKETGMGVEECGRTERYRYLQALAASRDAVIAVAHHREDSAETVLMNIGRGCGIDGLKGIAYRHGRIIRPLLDFSKAEIVQICSCAGIVPMTDSTNFEDCTLRNRVRNHVLPYLSETFGRDMTDKLIDLSRRARVDCGFIEEYATNLYKDMVKTEGNARVVDRTLFTRQHTAIQYRIVRKIIAAISNPANEFLYPEGKDLSGETIERVCRHLLTGKSGKMVDVGRKIQCRIEGNRGVFYYCTENDPVALVKYPTVEIYAAEKLNSTNLRLDTNSNVAYFDYDQLHPMTQGVWEKIEMRHIRPGDSFIPYGMQGHVRLQKFLIDKKIPFSHRKEMWIVSIGEDILWIPGIRRSNIGPVTDQTKNIVQINVKMEDVYDGEQQ